MKKLISVVLLLSFILLTPMTSFALMMETWLNSNNNYMAWFTPSSDKQNFQVQLSNRHSSNTTYVYVYSESPTGSDQRLERSILVPPKQFGMITLPSQPGRRFQVYTFSIPSYTHAYLLVHDF